jgi:hypothetical protein
MGYDLYGNQPTSAKGRHLRHSMWRWYPLVELCQTLASHECEPCTGWLINDGSGLESEDARHLADRLDQLVTVGSAAAYLRARHAVTQALPHDSPDRHAQVDADDVNEFIHFLRDSGGFGIW